MTDLGSQTTTYAQFAPQNPADSDLGSQTTAYSHLTPQVGMGVRARRARLDRRLQIRMDGLRHGRYDVWLARVDDTHSNLMQAVPVQPWPSAGQWAELRTADRLSDEDLGRITATNGVRHLSLRLPMPGVARLRLVPANH